jgi:[ribosomal protein S5]-alanine N-acetyltransferase
VLHRRSRRPKLIVDTSLVWVSTESRNVALRSSVCIVRSYRPDDAASIARHGNNRRIWENLRDRFPHPFTEANGAEYIARVLKDEKQTSFAIDVGGEAVGGITLHIGTDIERIGAEMGYWIGEELWGRGIATAAIRLVTNYAFSHFGLVRVFAIPFTSNVGSCRALEKAGYEREGLMRRSALKDGQIRDQFLYAKILD